jgi:MFS family permease
VSEARATDGPALSTGLAGSTWSLFVGLFLLLCGAGLASSVIGVRGEMAGFSKVSSGLIATAYYAGFLIGTRLTVAALGRVGHVRVFSAYASVCAASILVVGLRPNPAVWVIMRAVIGMCMAGQYVVVESWLNGLSTNATRGRLLAFYSIVYNAGFGAGQLMLGLGDPGTLTLFVGASVLFSLAAVPLSLSETTGPPIETAAHLSLRELAEIVPTGVGSAVLIGVAHGAMTGLAAVYATAAGLSIGKVALFATIPVIGGVLIQIPMSMASDDLDRRAVALAAAVLAAGAAVHLAFVDPGSTQSFIVLFALGGLSYPLYAFAAAYTNDWTPPDRLVAAASQLLTMYGIGAIAGPLLVSALMAIVGPEGYFWATAALHLLLAIFLIYRRRAWRAPLVDRPWNEVSVPARLFVIPATVVSVGRRLRKPVDKAETK